MDHQTLGRWDDHQCHVAYYIEDCRISYHPLKLFTHILWIIFFEHFPPLDSFHGNNSLFKLTRLRVNVFKMKLRPCQDHVCQDHVCQDMFVKTCLSRHVCQDHVFFSKPCHDCQDHVIFSRFMIFEFDPIWSNLIQFDPIWSNMIEYDPTWYTFDPTCLKHANWWYFS